MCSVYISYDWYSFKFNFKVFVLQLCPYLSQQQSKPASADYWAYSSKCSYLISRYDRVRVSQQMNWNKDQEFQWTDIGKWPLGSEYIPYCSNNTDDFPKPSVSCKMKYRVFPLGSRAVSGRNQTPGFNTLNYFWGRQVSLSGFFMWWLQASNLVQRWTRLQ